MSYITRTKNLKQNKKYQNNKKKTKYSLKLFCHHQVAPAELEEVLLEHPQVVDAAVIGVKDKEAGELPKAFVVRKNDQVTAEEIHQFVQGLFNSW